ncbi:hypothetical protein M2347_002503 [Chryseobacterium sp. H1D6B]|uniref:hypothetical protein n=1 Tax=Chryseobacterium sp. H1D6B TaxID=2940588 RepID=UPI0015CAD809|nr:hypothetical protein [Chryseobacterium sp. H1D6B]MDH6252776.1 hypothetical protein [Chryseobacterium sp. H1D6B]
MIIHFIHSGETLESIAEEIKLENPKYLKEYHNQRCAREDYIEDKLIPRKKLLIPNIYEIREYNAKNDAPFKSPERNPKLNFKPENTSQEYTVTITEIKEEETIEKGNKFSYKAVLSWIKKEQEQHLFHLSKEDFYIEEESKMTDLALECIRSLNPVEIRTNAKGEVLKVKLLQETIDGFKNTKERLNDLFPDQYAKIYIEEFEYAVLNEELFNKRMKEDTFIKMYFAPLRNEFKNGSSSFTQFLSEENTAVNVLQNAAIAGNTQEIILQQTMQPSEKNSSFGYKGKYTFHADTGLIKKAETSSYISQFGVKMTTHLMIED